MSKGFRGTLERTINHAGSAFSDLFLELDSPESNWSLFYELGLAFPTELLDNGPFMIALGKAGQAGQAITPLLEALTTAIEAEDVAAVLDAVIKIADSIDTLVRAISTIGTALSDAASTTPDAGTVAAFAAKLPERLVGYLLIRYFEEEFPLLLSVLELFALVKITSERLGPDPAPPFYIKRVLQLEKLGDLLRSPGDFMRIEYKWGEANFDGELLLRRIRAIFLNLNVLSTLTKEPDKPTELNFRFLRLRPQTNLRPPGLQAVLDAALTEDISIPLARFGDNWRIDLGLKGAFSPGLGIALQPPLQLQLEPVSAGFSGEAYFHMIGAAAEPSQSFTLLSLTAGSRLEATRVSVTFGAGFKSQGTNARGEIDFAAKIEHGKLIIKSSDADSFVARLLPSDGLTIDFNIEAGCSSDRGVYFSGSAGLETTLAIGLSLGPISIPCLHVAIIAGPTGVTLEASATVVGSLGPLAASVDRIGIASELKFQGGNLGPVDLGVSFKPPNGLGIVIEAGPITGGGFIAFDFENQRYAGVLQLKLYSIGVTAIGLLDTKLPGGQSGFSFLIIIAVEFTPIQIGFGFTLNGVGGLAGIYRTIVTQVLRDGLRQKSLDSILFPPEPVKRATQLISDLRRVFPPAENRYVFGPMLKIGWGPFLEASLGVILEVPSPVRIIILGQLDVLMPDRHAPIVELHLDVLGIIDFGEKLFSLDASLYDSRVALFNISGDMALRLSWGDNPSFALSVGGFNPHFQPPPAFPTLRRLCISLGYEDNPRLSLEAYFAVTSNSFQFGASLSLYASLGPLEIKGFMGFDALFIFQPFSFIIDFQASLELSIWGFKLLGIYLSATLSGPTPYHIIGEAKVSILFFEISAHIDFTFGEEKHESVPGADPWPLLEAAVKDQRNWSAALPPSSVAVVTLAAPEGSKAPVLIDPVGGATLRQKVVPLNQRLTKFGEAAPKDHEIFQLEKVKVGSLTIKPPSPELKLVSDHFAPGQFREMTDAEKISSPSFVDLTAGFTLASDAVTAGGGMEAAVEYTTKLIDTRSATSVDAGTHPVDSRTLLQMSRRGAQGSELASAGLGKYSPSPTQSALVALAEEKFIVAQKADLKVRTDITEPVSKGMAQLALADYLNRKPHERETLQVIAEADIEVAA